MSATPEGLKKFSLFHVLIIITLAIGLYLNTLKNGFVYDDEFTILNNTFIKTFDNLPLLFDKTAYFSRSKEMSYRPVVTFTYFIDYALYGLKPWGYHLTNVLLHAINGALLYIFLTLLLTPGTVPILRRSEAMSINRDSPLSHSSRFTSPPFLISILFVSHPVLTEAVNCISYREDLLAFLFYIATLSLYLRLKQPTSNHRPLAGAFLYLLSCLTHLLALLSKEMAVTLPLIVVCYEWLYGRENTKLLTRLFNRYAISYIMITLFYLYPRFYLFHNLKEQIGAWGLVERFLTMPWLIMNYLKLSLFPVQLSADYVINLSSPFSPVFILPVIALVFVFATIILHPPLDPLPSREGKQTVPSPLAGEGQGEGALRQRSILFGAIFFLITLTPVYNLIPLTNPFAERYLYLPLAGFIISTVYITYLIAEKLKGRPEHINRYMPIVFLVVSIIFSFSVVNRNIIWKDDYSLWSDTVIKMPNSNRAHKGIGIAHFEQGRYDEAIREYLMIIKLRVNDAKAHYNLGLAYLRQGSYDEAIDELKTAIRLKPDDLESHSNLGIAYSRQGLFDQAVKELLMAIRLKPDDADAHYNLGIAYSRQGLFYQAVKELLTAIRLKPDDAEAHYNLGVVYFEQGRYDETINEFTAALKLRPDYKKAYHSLEVLMKERKGYKDAGPSASQDKNRSP